MKACNLFRCREEVQINRFRSKLDMLTAICIAARRFGVHGVVDSGWVGFHQVTGQEVSTRVGHLLIPKAPTIKCRVGKTQFRALINRYGVRHQVL